MWPSVPWRAACEVVFWKVPTLCLDSGIVSPSRLRWVKGVRVFRCNLSPALLTDRPGPFTCHCGNMWVERTPNKSQHTKLTLEKNILPPLPLGFELATFRSRVRRSNQQAIPARFYQCIRSRLSVSQSHFVPVPSCPIAMGLRPNGTYVFPSCLFMHRVIYACCLVWTPLWLTGLKAPTN